MKKIFIFFVLAIALMLSVNAQDVRFSCAHPGQPAVNRSATQMLHQTRDGWMSWASTLDVSTGIGTGSAAIFTIAQRFDVSDLADHVGEYISRVKFAPYGTTGTFTVIIYKGGSYTSSTVMDPGQIVYQQAVPSYVPNAENVVLINQSIQIEANNEYWIALEINATGSYPAGAVDLNNSVPGKGDLLMLNNAWSTLGENGLDYNWALAFYTQSTDPMTEQAIVAAASSLSWSLTDSETPDIKQVNILANNLTSAITATTAAPFEISSDSVTFGTTATLPATGGMLYTKFNATTAGTYTGSISLTSTGANTEVITLSGEIIDCSTPATLPLVESFESTDNLTCWTGISANTENSISLSNQYASHGTLSLRFSSYNDAESTGDFNQYMITPVLPTNVDKIVAFDYMCQTYGEESFRVGYSTTTNELDSFTWGSFTVCDNETWLSYINTAIPAAARYVAINYYGDYQYYLFVDNFKVIEYTDCLFPTNVVASNITGHEATITWTPAESAQGTETFLVEYAVVGTETWQQVTATTNSVVLTGLLAETNYEVRVSMDCGGGTVSMASMATFSTIEACRMPLDLTISQITGTSALVSWTPDPLSYNGTQEFVIEYMEQIEGAVPQTITTTNTHCFLPGLTPQTSYSVMLYMNCGVEDGLSDTLTDDFTTKCLVGGDMPIGEGTETSSYLPSYSFYKYGYSQQIFLASELNGAMEFNSISLDASAVSMQRTVKIYLMHTSSTDASSWLPATNAQLVYTGSTPTATGWNTHQFTTPFQYNGTDNLALIIVDSTGSYISGTTWKVHSTSFTSSKYIYTDSV